MKNDFRLDLTDVAFGAIKLMITQTSDSPRYLAQVKSPQAKSRIPKLLRIPAVHFCYSGIVLVVPGAWTPDHKCGRQLVGCLSPLH